MDGAEGLVPRKRLFDLLSGPPNLRVVAAPSGFGKTTLLRSWIDALPAGERALVWVALSAEVATRRDFWQLVGASAARAGDLTADTHRTLAGEIESLDDPVPAIAGFLDGRGPSLLVLDAYEHLREVTDEIDDDLVRLASGASGLDVVVTTRAATRLTDDVLAMRGVVRVIGEDDLRFTTDEVEELLGRHAPHALDAAARIVRDTRGYPLGVRAVAYALQRRKSVPSFDGTAWQRLVTEDLKSQLADRRLFDFVLDTSVPPYFDRRLARELTGADDVDQALAELAWNGFGRWIPYARERPAFQYVESVRDVFLSQLRAEQPARYERSAGLAAAWLHRHDDNELALALAVEARQFELASTICRSLLLSGPDIYTTNLFERHLRLVPRRLLSRYPTLAFFRAMAYSTNEATRGSAAEYFRLAAAHMFDDPDRLAPPEAFYRYVGLEVCLRYLGRSQEATDAARKGLTILDSMSSAERDELGDFLSLALGLFAHSLFQAGDVERASTLVEQAPTSAVLPWWRNQALAFVVGIQALDGRVPGARSALALTDADALVEHGRRLPHALGVLGKAALRLDEFDFAGALREFDDTDGLMTVGDSWPFITWVLMHARLGMGAAGTEAHRVTAALTAKPPPPGLGPNLATAAMLNALAILWLADGNTAKGRPLLRSDIPCSGQLAPAQLLDQLVTGDPALAVRNVAGLLAEPGHTVRSTAAVETLGAAAALRAANDRTALKLLERAASRYQLFGVRAHLMYVPDGDLAALRELARAGHSTACEAYLAGRVVTPITSADSAPVLLTRREIEVLTAWAAYRTRVEVANALFVSANTVKSQLNSAYRKLGVTTKDAAIQRAIELDLMRRPDG